MCNNRPNPGPPSPFVLSLKGTHPDKVREEVDLFVASVGMLDKRHFYANQLSGK